MLGWWNSGVHILRGGWRRARLGVAFQRTGLCQVQIGCDYLVMSGQRRDESAEGRNASPRLVQFQSSIYPRPTKAIIIPTPMATFSSRINRKNDVQVQPQKWGLFLPKQVAPYCPHRKTKKNKVRCLKDRKIRNRDLRHRHVGQLDWDGHSQKERIWARSTSRRRMHWVRAAWEDKRSTTLGRTQRITVGWCTMALRPSYGEFSISPSSQEKRSSLFEGWKKIQHRYLDPDTLRRAFAKGMGLSTEYE